MLNRTGFKGIEIVGVTPDLPGIRGLEAEAWLKENDHVSGYVILDDDGDFLKYQTPRLVQTDVLWGLIERDVRMAIDILGRA